MLTFGCGFGSGDPWYFGMTLRSFIIYFFWIFFERGLFGGLCDTFYLIEILEWLEWWEWSFSSFLSSTANIFPILLHIFCRSFTTKLFCLFFTKIVPEWVLYPILSLALVIFFRLLWISLLLSPILFWLLLCPMLYLLLSIFFAEPHC